MGTDEKDTPDTEVENTNTFETDPKNLDKQVYVFSKDRDEREVDLEKGPKSSDSEPTSTSTRSSTKRSSDSK